MIVLILVEYHQTKLLEKQFYFFFFEEKPTSSHFIGKFQSIRRKLRYQLYLVCHKIEDMEEVYKTGHKNLQNVLEVEEILKNFSQERKFLSISRYRSLVMSCSKPDNFM